MKTWALSLASAREDAEDALTRAEVISLDQMHLIVLTMTMITMIQPPANAVETTAMAVETMTVLFMGPILGKLVGATNMGQTIDQTMCSLLPL